MSSRAPDFFSSHSGRSENKDKVPVRYRIAICSATLFLGWLILELTQAF